MPENNQGETENILGFPLKSPDLTSLRKGGFVLYGTDTLVSGVLTITDNRIKPWNTTFKNGSVAMATYNASGGTMGSTLRAVCTARTLTITSMKITGTAPDAGGAITITGTTANTSDTSTVNWLIIL